jgi:tropinone reductase I
MMKNTRWTLSGKKAVVTGATKGIGKAIAQDLLELGASVALVARSEAEVQSVVSEFQKDSLAAFGVAADVAETDGRGKILKAVEKEFGELDILINNVGTNIRKPALDYSNEEYETLWHTNVTSAFEMSRLVHQLLRESESPSIVNVVSVAGIVSVGTGTIYGMTKAALIQMTRGLAVEWGAEKIRVNAVAPWFTYTPLTESLLTQEAVRSRVLTATPIGRIAEPEDVSGIVAFLCLPAASYITGQCIAADGGFLAKGF